MYLMKLSPNDLEYLRKKTEYKQMKLENPVIVSQNSNSLSSLLTEANIRII